MCTKIIILLLGKPHQHPSHPDFIPCLFYSSTSPTNSGIRLKIRNSRKALREIQNQQAEFLAARNEKHVRGRYSSQEITNVNTETSTSSIRDTGIYQLERLVDREEDEPLIDREGERLVNREEDEPLIAREEDEPLVDREEDRPLVDREEDRPLVDREEDRPLVDREEDRPLVDREEDEPLVDREEDEPLVDREEDRPLPCEEEVELLIDREEDESLTSEEGTSEEEELSIDGEEDEAMICQLDLEDETQVDTSTVGFEEEHQCEQCTNLKMENELLRKQLANVTFGFRMIEGSDKKTRFYTGLPSYPVFVHLYLFLTPSLTSCKLSKLSLEDELFLVLVRLRLNLLLDDLAIRFKVTISVVSRIIQRWLNVMFVRLSFLISWPDRSICQQNMPVAFKETYPKCRCVIDCSEIFIETPKNFTARNKTYSNYKRHNTIKFLIGITPMGTICFLSKCWGGRVSDKVLTRSSNFYKLLERDDTILADRGFTIAEDIAVFGADLRIPSFTRGKKQLTQKEVETSKQLSRVRIHIERVIGLLKNKYLILRGPIPISVLKHSKDTEVANIDKILTVCCALINLSKSIV